MNEQTKELVNIPATESIKVIKGAKNYQWEIKILSLDVEHIAKIDAQMREKFGSGLE